MATQTSSDNNDPLYFWNQKEKDGYLCQWYSVTFTAPAHPASEDQNPMTFSSTEQYMMYHKAMTFHDPKIAAQIMKLSNPRQQKAKGRQIMGFNDETWNDVREKIVEDGNWWKFTATRDEKLGNDLRLMLLNTGNRLLVEASPNDSIWGIGYDAVHAELNREHWGLNLLGEALMKVRARMREESERNKA